MTFVFLVFKPLEHRVSLRSSSVTVAQHQKSVHEAFHGPRSPGQRRFDGRHKGKGLRLLRLLYSLLRLLWFSSWPVVGSRLASSTGGFPVGRLNCGNRCLPTTGIPARSSPARTIQELPLRVKQSGTKTRTANKRQYEEKPKGGGDKAPNGYETEK